MAKITTWPYRRAEKHRLSGGGWQLRLPSGDVPLAEDLPSWDATADLRMVRKVYLDTSGVWTDCGLPVGTPLCVTACWEASGTKLRGTGTRTVVSTPNERTEVRLGVALKGAEIGGKIRVSVAVTLGATIEQRPIRAFRAGTLLCEDVIDVQIEGGGSRFPMEEISFQAAGPQFPKGAAWRLDRQQPDDHELPVLGSIRLFLNKDHPAMKGLVEDPNRPESKVLGAMMMVEVTRALVRQALTGEALSERSTEWPTDSVGRVITRIFKAHFRDLGADALREIMLRDPDRFDAILQDRLGLLRHT